MESRGTQEGSRDHRKSTAYSTLAQVTDEQQIVGDHYGERESRSEARERERGYVEIQIRYEPGNGIARSFDRYERVPRARRDELETQTTAVSP